MTIINGNRFIFLFFLIQEDINLNGYTQHIAFQYAPAPLTYAEEELEMIRKNEVRIKKSLLTTRPDILYFFFLLTCSEIIGVMCMDIPNSNNKEIFG